MVEEKKWSDIEILRGDKLKYERSLNDSNVMLKKSLNENKPRDDFNLKIKKSKYGLMDILSKDKRAEIRKESLGEKVRFVFSSAIKIAVYLALIRAVFFILWRYAGF